MRENIDVAVLLLPRISCAADFECVLKEEGVSLRYTGINEDFGKPGLLIIPATRNTIEDLTALKRSGCAHLIKSAAKEGCVVLGIGGGFQMLGTKIIDIKTSEMRFSKCVGFGFFNIVTRLMPSRISSRTEFILPQRGGAFEAVKSGPFTGYETHIGRTRYLKGSMPLFTVTKRDGVEVEVPDGAVNENMTVFGTYIHGIFDNGALRKEFMNIVRKKMAEKYERA